MPLKEPISPPWEYWGQYQAWLTRSGDTEILHGQAFWPRTSVPPEYGTAEHLDYPDVTAEAPPIDDSRTYYWPPFTWGSLYLHFTEAYTGDEFCGLSIFQVNPRAIGKDWERKHTRLVESYKELEVVGAGWADYPFDLAWPCSTAAELRIFARVYNRTAFLNFGPMTATTP